MLKMLTNKSDVYEYMSFITVTVEMYVVLGTCTYTRT